MAILTIQLSGQQRNPDGSEGDVPPDLVLQQRGPVLQVAVGLVQAMSEQLAQRGEPVPTPVTGWAMVDTGASGTCIDESIAAQLGLPVIDVVRMATPSHDSVEKNVHPAAIHIMGIELTVNLDRAMGANLANQGLIALIGRDFLSTCTLHYNGLAGNFTIAR